MEIKTKFNLGDEVFKIAPFSEIQRPSVLDVGTVVGFQITQNGIETIVRFSGTDRSYPDDVLSTKTEVNEYWADQMRAYIEGLKREIADCEKELEDYENARANESI